MSETNLARVVEHADEGSGKAWSVEIVGAFSILFARDKARAEKRCLELNAVVTKLLSEEHGRYVDALDVVHRARIEEKKVMERMAHALRQIHHFIEEDKDGVITPGYAQAIEDVEQAIAVYDAGNGAI